MMIDPYRYVTAAGFTYTATSFDGASYLNRGANITGMANGPRILSSFWIKMGAGTDDQTHVIHTNAAGTGGFIIYRDSSDNRIHVLANDSGFNLLVNMASDTDSVKVSSGWVHVLIEIDTTTAGRRYIAINGVDQTHEFTFTTGSDMLLPFANKWNFAVNANNDTPSCKALFSEVYFTTPAAWQGLSTAKPKFFNSGTSKPVDLGADGSTPTGTQPLIYLRNAFGTFQTNLGSGGNFTVTGTLIDGGSDKP